MAQNKVERMWRNSKREGVDPLQLVERSQVEDLRLSTGDSYDDRDAALQYKAELKRAVANVEQVDESVRALFFRAAAPSSKS